MINALHRQTDRQTDRRYKSVDYIKGIAMMMIIMVHYGQNFQIGIAKLCKYMQMGCPMFFVASGFGIMCLINNRYKGKMNLVNIKQFYISRFKALAPGWYIAFLIVYLVNTGGIYFCGETLSFGSNREYLSIICNLLFLNGLFPFCNNNVMPGGWYIGTTVILYILTPLIFMTLNKMRNKKRFFIVSSAFGMFLWGVLYTVFDRFLENGFGYFFFLVHYPEFLLGMILYYDLLNNVFSAKTIRLCLPCSIVSFVLAVMLFYSSVPFGSFFSAWMTAFATYFMLYYMISKEKMGKQRKSVNVLADFGRNSYCIFLLHAFVVWPFVDGLVKLLEIINIPQMISFFMLIPVAMGGAYILGLALRIVVKKITNAFWRIAV